MPSDIQTAGSVVMPDTTTNGTCCIIRDEIIVAKRNAALVFLALDPRSPRATMLVTHQLQKSMSDTLQEHE